MAGIGGSPTIGTVDLYTSNASKGNMALGSLFFGEDGKAFRYAKFGELGVVGDIMQAKAVDTQFTEMTVPSNTSAGTNTLVITNGTTVVVADEFADGSAVIAVTPGLGEEYTILGNSAAANGAALTLHLDRPLRSNLTAAGTKVTLSWSPWYSVVKYPTSSTGVQAGVCIYPVASGEYGWLQTKGVCGVLADNSSGAVGSDVGVPGASAGSVGVNVAGTGKSNTVGRAMKALSSGKVIPVYLSID